MKLWLHSSEKQIFSPGIGGAGCGEVLRKSVYRKVADLDQQLTSSAVGGIVQLDLHIRSAVQLWGRLPVLCRTVILPSSCDFQQVYCASQLDVTQIYTLVVKRILGIWSATKLS